MGWGYYDYESPADRKKRTAKEIEKRRKKGEPFVQVPPGKNKRGVPAATFWGRAWCENLESYSDFASRLPRGRSYLRAGNVYDLEITPGNIFARVTGTDFYEVEIQINSLPAVEWRTLKESVAGQVTNLVDLLGGKLGAGVMEAMTDRKTGLFPSPKRIKLDCTCPDWATMCKHVSAVLYGVGVKLDEEPELLFVLRKVDHLELIAQAAESAGEVGDLTGLDAATQVLEAGDLSELFGIEITDPEAAF